MSTTSPSTTPAPPSTGGGRRRTGRWVVAWALSLGLAFLLGTQVGTWAQPDAAGRAATPAQSTPARTEPTPSAPGLDPELERLLLDLPRRDASDARAMGAVDAKVVLTNWSDYRCPFCVQWHQETLPSLEKFVDDGSLRIEFRDLALFGEQSEATAVAARAAGQQGRFWEYQEAVFSAAPTSGQADIERDDLVAFARTAGVSDLASFEAALDDEALLAAVQAESAEARQLGISGTPFFVVGSRALSGAQPAGVFDTVIEQELAR